MANEEEERDKIIRSILRKAFEDSMDLISRMEPGSLDQVSFEQMYPPRLPKRKRPLKRLTESSSALVEQTEDKESFTVMIHMDGVRKDEIFLSCFQNQMVLFTKGSTQINRTIDFPGSVDPRSAEAVFRNNVMVVTVKKSTAPVGVSHKVVEPQ